MNFRSAEVNSLKTSWQQLQQRLSARAMIQFCLPMLSGGALTLLFLQLGIASYIEPFAHRLLFQSRGSQTWDERLVLVKIDQASLDEFGWFPWERDRYAELLNILSDAGDNLAVFNIIFSEETEDDERFAKAMAKHGKVVLSSAWHPNRESWEPNPQLRQEAIAIGHIAKLGSAEQHPISILPYVQNQPALAIAVAEAYQLSQEQLSQGPTLALPSSDHPLWTNWPGAVQQLEQYSFADVVNHRVDPEVFANKIVVVGTTALGLDSIATPFNPETEASSIHLHGAIVHNLLNHNFLRRPPFWLWSASLLGGICIIRWVTRRSIQQQTLGLLVIGMGWLFLSWGLLYANILLPITLPLLFVSSTGFSLSLGYNWRFNHVKRQLQNQMLQQRQTSQYELETQVAQRTQALSQANAAQDLLIAELNHRVKNILALIRSITRQTTASTPAIADYASILENRIAALASAHELAARPTQDEAKLEDLLQIEFRPYLSASNLQIQLTGPEVKLNANLVLTFVLVIHELVSNAAKYGALSVSGGQVDVSWEQQNGGLALSWREQGGPEVSEPSRSGFGRTLIERAIAYEFDGESRLSFTPGGVEADIWIPEHLITWGTPVPQQPESHAPVALPLASREAVLILADHVVLAVELEQAMQSLGFQRIDTVPRAHLAFDLIDTHQYTLSIIDLDVKGDDSFAFAAELRKREIPLLLTLSQYTSPRSPSDTPCLVKPIHNEELNRTVTQLLAVS